MTSTTASRACVSKAFWALLPVAGVLITLSFLLGVEWASDSASRHSLAVSQRNREVAEQRWLADLEVRLGPAGPALDRVALARGQARYEQSCSACHGADGLGVEALGGKNLVRSPFVTQHGDTALAQFIGAGRDVSDPLNTSGMAMPPKGGNDELSEGDLADIVTYLRGLQDPRRWPQGQLPVVLIEEPEVAPAIAVASMEAAGAGDSVSAVPASGVEAEASATDGVAAMAAIDPEAIKRGKRAYMSCLACHGKDGTGVKGTGKDLIHSPFVASSTEDELLAFIKVGRGPTDEGNTTGIAMPPKGGNPALKDEQIKDIVTYLRSLQQAAGVEFTAG